MANTVVMFRISIHACARFGGGVWIGRVRRNERRPTSAIPRTINMSYGSVFPERSSHNLHSNSVSTMPSSHIGTRRAVVCADTDGRTGSSNVVLILKLDFAKGLRVTNRTEFRASSSHPKHGHWPSSAIPIRLPQWRCADHPAKIPVVQDSASRSVARRSRCR